MCDQRNMELSASEYVRHLRVLGRQQRERHLEQLPVSRSLLEASMKRFVPIAAGTVFTLVFIGLGISNFVLRRQLDAAQQQLRVRQSVLKQTGGVLRVGDAIPSFAVRDRAGRTVNLGGASNHDWLLVLVHPKCKYCQQVLRDVAQDVRTSAITASTTSNVAVVSLASMQLSPEILQTLPATVPAYFADRGRLPGSAAVRVVPQIVHVGGDGKVIATCPSFD